MINKIFFLFEKAEIKKQKAKEAAAKKKAEESAAAKAARLIESGTSFSLMSITESANNNEKVSETLSA